MILFASAWTRLCSIARSSARRSVIILVAVACLAITGIVAPGSSTADTPPTTQVSTGASVGHAHSHGVSPKAKRYKFIASGYTSLYNCQLDGAYWVGYYNADGFECDPTPPSGNYDLYIFWVY